MLACAGGPSGPGGDINGNGSSTDPNGTLGPLGSSPGSVNPGTRPTPGFTEVEMNPATSTSLPAPAAFLKNLQLNLTPLIRIDEVRLFVRDLNLDDAVSAGLEYPGNFLFKLVNDELIVDQSLPALGVADVPEGTYEKLELAFEVMDADEIPAGSENDPLINVLLGHSIVVEGVIELATPIVILPTVSLSLIHFRFVSDQMPNIRVNSVQGFDFGPDLNRLFLAFKIRTWIDLSLAGIISNAVAALDAATLLQLVSGLLVIDDSGGLSGIALQLETNINTSMRVAPSLDGIFDELDVQEDSFSEVF